MKTNIVKTCQTAINYTNILKIAAYFLNRKLLIRINLFVLFKFIKVNQFV